MKLIHTSDWHIGQQLYGYDREVDHRDFFRQLKEICGEELPDALIVSGDIFDVSSPSASCMRMFTDFLLELHKDVPEMKIVATSGNHDSASRIDVNRNLWRAAGIYVIGTVKRVNGEYDFTDNIVEVGDKGVILALPYINPSFMGCSAGDAEGEKTFLKRGAECVAKIKGENLPAVLMAHLTVADCDRQGHRVAQVGKIDSIPADAFPEFFDYVALGHIHKPQNLTSNRRIRYAGSPVAISFDEDYPHSVSVVEIEKGSGVSIREVEIIPKRELMTFPHEAADFKNVIRQLKRFPAREELFLRLNVRQPFALPSDCEEQATMATEGKKCRYCTIKFEYTGDGDRENIRSLSLTEFAELTTVELASRFFNSKGISDEETAEYIRMLSEIEDEIKLESCR